MSKNSNSSPNTGLPTPFPFSIYPNEWITNQPNTILIVSGYTTTGGTYTGSVQITDSTQTEIASFSFNAVGGNSVINITPIPMVSTYSTNFPWTVNGTITASLGTAQFLQPAQFPISLKPDGTVACYSTTVLSNDGGSDNDWNDLVLNFQLFNDSTD
jgi:hypothetical protein